MVSSGHMTSTRCCTNVDSTSLRRTDVSAVVSTPSAFLVLHMYESAVDWELRLSTMQYGCRQCYYMHFHAACMCLETAIIPFRGVLLYLHLVPLRKHTTYMYLVKMPVWQKTYPVAKTFYYHFCQKHTSDWDSAALSTPIITFSAEVNFLFLNNTYRCVSHVLTNSVTEIKNRTVWWYGFRYNF